MWYFVHSEQNWVTGMPILPLRLAELSFSGDEMALEVKCLSSKPDNLSSSLGSHMVGGET